MKGNDNPSLLWLLIWNEKRNIEMEVGNIFFPLKFLRSLIIYEDARFQQQFILLKIIMSSGKTYWQLIINRPKNNQEESEMRIKTNIK